jgi:hypothetical protein
MENETLIIHKTCEVYSLGFFEELRELIGISRGVHLDLSNSPFPPLFVASSLYRGSCLS